MWESGVRRVGPLTLGPRLLYFVPSLIGHLYGSFARYSQLEKSTNLQPEHHLFRRHLLQPSAEQLCKAPICGSACYCMWASMLFFVQVRCCKCARLTLMVTPSPGPFFFLVLPRTKSSRRHQHVPDYFSNLLLRLQPGELRYPYGGMKFRTAFDHLVRRVRLPALSPQYRPHSLRRDGATAHFMQVGSLDRTVVRSACICTARLLFQ